MTKKPTETLRILERIFGAGSDMPSRLIQEVGENEALRIGYSAARQITNRYHRVKYVMAWVERPRKIAELLLRLDHVALENLAPEELRDLPEEDLRACYRERRELEAEFDALTRGRPAFELLVEAVGQRRAGAMFGELAGFFCNDVTVDSEDEDEWGKIGKRVDTIMTKASRARNPERYVMACIRNERAARGRKGQKHSRRQGRG